MESNGIVSVYTIKDLLKELQKYDEDDTIKIKRWSDSTYHRVLQIKKNDYGDVIIG